MSNALLLTNITVAVVGLTDKSYDSIQFVKTNKSKETKTVNNILLKRG